MLYGMGTVFVFLTILVFATLLMSRIVARFPSAVRPQHQNTNDAALAAAAQPSPQIRAAIKLAIEQHRQATRRQV